MKWLRKLIEAEKDIYSHHNNLSDLKPGVHKYYVQVHIIMTCQEAYAADPQVKMLDLRRKRKGI